MGPCEGRNEAVRRGSASQAGQAGSGGGQAAARQGGGRGAVRTQHYGRPTSGRPRVGFAFGLLGSLIAHLQQTDVFTFRFVGVVGR
eukprot:4213948-Prymnesium_polylepis.2